MPDAEDEVETRIKQILQDNVQHGSSRLVHPTNIDSFSSIYQRFEDELIFSPADTAKF